MMDGGVEIGEIADDRGERVFHPRLKHEQRSKAAVDPILQQPSNTALRSARQARTELHQTVQHRPAALRTAARASGPIPRLAAQKAQIQHLIPIAIPPRNGSSEPRRRNTANGKF